MRWLLLFIGFPVLEIALLVHVGGIIGPLNVFAALVAAAMLGAFVIRNVGQNGLLKMRDDLSAKKVPEMEMLSSMLVFLGGLLFILPGFISDAIALFLLIPFTRELFMKGVVRYLRNRQNAVGQTYTHPGGAKVFFYSSTQGRPPQDSGRQQEYYTHSPEHVVIDCHEQEYSPKAGEQKAKEQDPNIIDCEYTEVPPAGLPEGEDTDKGTGEGTGPGSGNSF